MSYTLGQAAKATGVNKMTISRAIKSGKISAEKNETGGYRIDPSELHRVFPPVTGVTVTKKEDVTLRYPKSDTLLQEFKELEARLHGELEIRLEMTNERLREKDMVIAEVRQERDDWKKQAQTLLLQSPEAKANKSSPQPLALAATLFLCSVLAIVLASLA